MQPEISNIEIEFYDWIEHDVPEDFIVDEEDIWRDMAGAPAVLVAKQKIADSLRHKYGGGVPINGYDNLALIFTLHTYSAGETPVRIWASNRPDPEEGLEVSLLGDTLELKASPSSMYWMLEALARGFSEDHSGNGVYNMKEIETHELKDDEYIKVYAIEGGTVSAYFTKRPRSPEQIIHPEIINIARTKKSI